MKRIGIILFLLISIIFSSFNMNLLYAEDNEEVEITETITEETNIPTTEEIENEVYLVEEKEEAVETDIYEEVETDISEESKNEELLEETSDKEVIISPSLSKLKNFDLIKIYDGTVPFDENDDAGNDSNASNLIVRSFDKIVYRTSYSTVSVSEFETVKNGVLRFKAELPVSPSIASFDIKAMEWLENVTIVNGDDFSSIEGTINIENDIVSPRVGTLNWTVEVRNATNGQVIKAPTFYMAVNDEEYISTVGEDIIVSAKANVNAKINHEGFIKDKPVFSFVLELLANKEGKGIKGQEIININEGIEFNLVSNTNEKILSYKVNNYEQIGEFDTNLVGKNVPISGNYETLFNQVYYSGNINIENSQVKINGFEFDDFKNKVTNNANKNNNLYGQDYDDDHFPFGAYVFMSEKPVVNDNNQIYSFKIEDLTFKSLNGETLKETNLADNEATYLLSKPEGGGPGTAGGPAQFLTINVINPTTKERFSLISNDASRNTPPDYEVYPGELVQIDQGAMLYKSNYRPYIKKYYGLVKFDTRVFEALKDEEEYSSPKSTLKSVGFYWVAKSNKFGWANEEEMYNAHIDDVKNKNGYVLFDSASRAINEGYTIVGFLSECEFENPDYVITWDAYGTYPAVRVKKEALLNDEQTAILNNNDPKRVGVILAELQGIDFDNNVYNRLNVYNSLGDDEDMYRDGKNIKLGFIKSTYDANGIITKTSQSNAIGNRNGNWTHAASLVGGSFFVKSYNTYINQHVSQTNDRNDEKEVFNLDRNQYNVYFNFDAGTTLNNPTDITDDFVITQEIPKTLLPVSDSENIEEKWGISYDGEIVKDNSVDGIKIENSAGNLLESQTVTDIGAKGITYEVSEEDAGDVVKLIWKINNYPVSYKLPTIHFKAQINKEVSNGTEMSVKGEIFSKNIPKRNIDTVGIRTLKIGGASIEKIGLPETRNDDSIGFKISFKNDEIISKNSENIDVLALDILPTDDGINNLGLDLGDYYLDNIKMLATIYDDNSLDDIGPRVRFYYSTDDFKDTSLLLLDNNNLIELENHGFDFVDLPVIKTGNYYVLDNAAGIIKTAINESKITAIGILCLNIGNRSKFDFEYTYNWKDYDEKIQHEKNDIVYNRVDLAVGSNINQTTYDKAYSTPTISKEIVSINDKKSENINGLNGAYVQDEDIIEYKINFINPYAENCDIKVVDKIPEGTVILKDSISDNGQVIEDEVIWNFKEVPANSKLSVSFKVNVMENNSISKIDNIARVSFNDEPFIDTNLISNPKQIITASKDSNPVSGSIVRANQEIEYFIKVKNIGEYDVEEVYISDVVPSQTSFKLAKNEGVYNVDTKTVSFTIDKLAKGEEKTVSFIVSVNDNKNTEIIENVALYGIKKLNKETNKVIHKKEVVVNQEKPKEEVKYTVVNTGVKSKSLIYTLAIIFSLIGIYIVNDKSKNK